MKLKDLAVPHSYYCEESNWCDLSSRTVHSTMTDFLDDMENADMDYNLVFRWDIETDMDEEGNSIPDKYIAKIFVMHQRKGRYWPNYIQSVTEEELPRFQKYLEKQWEHMKKLWEPIV